MECPKIERWAHENGCELEDVCEKAATEGNLEILQLARKHGYAWDEKTCEAAARAGHLTVLQWAHASGCELGENLHKDMLKDYGNDHKDVIEWLCSLSNMTAMFINARHPRRVSFQPEYQSK